VKSITLKNHQVLVLKIMAFTSFYQVEILTNGIISIYLVIVKMLQGESNKIIIFENVMLVYLRLYNFRIILNRST
jgi:hypothetical protein